MQSLINWMYTGHNSDVPKRSIISSFLCFSPALELKRKKRKWPFNLILSTCYQTPVQWYQINIKFKHGGCVWETQGANYQVQHRATSNHDNPQSGIHKATVTLLTSRKTETRSPIITQGRDEKHNGQSKLTSVHQAPKSSWPCKL